MVEDVSSAARDTPDAAGEDLHIQPQGFLLELSLDWIVLRASENVHHFIGESHVRLIDEPLASFVQAQPLHDLRNLFSRLSGTTGVARAYRERMTDDGRRFDIAFQISEGRVLLEGTESPGSGLGQTLGSVVGLVDGLASSSGTALLDGAARRLRALTGFDCVTYVDAAGDVKAQSQRPGIPGLRQQARSVPVGQHSRLVADVAAEPVPIFPRMPRDTSAAAALLRSPRRGERDELIARGVGATMRIPVKLEGRLIGCFECDHCAPRKPNLELHAAGELFAQMLAMRLEIDRLRNG